jgi:hypothetical protein
MNIMASVRSEIRSAEPQRFSLSEGPSSGGGGGGGGGGSGEGGCGCLIWIVIFVVGLIWYFNAK